MGGLLICATPIGNLGDVTLRVLEALSDADVVAAEDTRVTRKLFARYGVETPLVPYHAHNIERRTPELLERMRAGETVALVSDAGTPGISDPGAHLVDACIDAGIAVDVLPGASAIVTALVASGLPTHAFYFGGFLPRKEGDRRKRIEAVAGLDATLLFYESPHRTASSLALIATIVPGRQAAVARELTKMHQEVARGTIGELAKAMADRDLKGEVVLVIGPPRRDEGDAIDDDRLRAMLKERIADGESRKDAVRAVTAETGAPRNHVYGLTLSVEPRDDDEEATTSTS